MQAGEFNKELINEKQRILRRLEEIDSQINDNLYKNGCMTYKPKERKMADETTQPVEQPKTKYTIAERKAKVIEMLTAKKDLKDIMTTVGVSNTYVYRIKRENNIQ